MDRKEFITAVTHVVSRYTKMTEMYDDDAQLRVDPETYDVRVVDGETADDAVEDADYFPMMDLIQMDIEGEWQPDLTGIDAVADEYFN